MREIIVALESTENDHVIRKLLEDFGASTTTTARQSGAVSVTDSPAPSAGAQQV